MESEYWLKSSLNRLSTFCDCPIDEMERKRHEPKHAFKMDTIENSENIHLVWWLIATSFWINYNRFTTNCHLDIVFFDQAALHSRRSY